jgi:hypothetical protein
MYHSFVYALYNKEMNVEIAHNSLLFFPERLHVYSKVNLLHRKLLLLLGSGFVFRGFPVPILALHRL